MDDKKEKQAKTAASSHSRVMHIVEGAMMVALAVLLDYLVLYKLPDGGSITLKLIPIVFFAVRYGCGWGFLAGLVFGGLNYISGNGVAIDWTSIVCDYFLAFGLLGFGAGLFKGKKLSAIWGSVVGGLLMFASSYLVGVFVWARNLSAADPWDFLGITFTNPWFYSLVYNGTWALPCIILAVVVFALLYQVKPVRRLLDRTDLK